MDDLDDFIVTKAFGDMTKLTISIVMITFNIQILLIQAIFLSDIRNFRSNDRYVGTYRKDLVFD